MLRKILLCLLTLPVLSFSACVGDQPGDVTDKPEEPVSNPNDLKAFNEEKYLKYFWEGGIVYNESVLPLEDESGYFNPADLLFGIKKIVSVRNSALDILYEEGRDYTVEEGKFLIKRGGRIPSVRHDEYFLAAPNVPEVALPCVLGGYLRYDELFFHQRQLAVTYETDGSWPGEVPASKTELLPKTAAKLAGKQPLRIVCIGDSITVGASASGCEGYGMKPNMPVWTKMGLSKLRRACGYDGISLENLAVGGSALLSGTQDGGEVQFFRAINKSPDLLVIGFGMNDCASPAASFMAKLNGLIARTRASLPDCEILLISSMLRNPYEVNSGSTFNPNLTAYEQAMLAAEGPGIAVMDMTAVHRTMLVRKAARYYDYTGNNINHPNDFLARAYAQVFLRTLGV